MGLRGPRTYGGLGIKTPSPLRGPRGLPWLRAYAAVVLGAEPGPQTPALLADTVYAWWDEEHKPSLASLGVQSWGAAALLICEVDALDVLDMEILLSFCEANNSAIQKAGVAAPTALMLSDLFHMAYYDAEFLGSFFNISWQRNFSPSLSVPFTHEARPVRRRCQANVLVVPDCPWCCIVCRGV